MGLFDRFRKRDTRLDPEDLRGALIDGFQRQDFTTLMSLINENTEAIRTQFPSWRTVPESIRKDPPALDVYGRMLVTIASLFERAGDSSLTECLSGSDRDNPIVQWQKDIERADGLINNGQAAAAVPILSAMVEQAQKLTGPGADAMRARTLGRLGIALSKTAETAAAIRVTREALELCQKTGDAEGIEAYQTNLKALGTYEITESDPKGKRVTVVFTDSEGRTLAPEDLPKTSGNIRWEVRTSDQLNPEADRLHKEGRDAGAKGDYDLAISLLTQAAELDPTWPYPVYDRAYSHLLKQDFDAALVDYRKTLELAPQGFFIAARAADMLTREKAGEFPRGLAVAVVMLADMPHEQQRSIAEQLVETFPSCAAAWNTHAKFIEDPAARLAAIESGLAARPDADTRGSLLVNKALAFYKFGDTDRAIEILKPLIEGIGDSLSTHAKAYVSLAMIRAKSAR